MWPSEYSELKRIEDLLVCGICYEYMETSVITSCSHNYCSLCIRKYLHYKTQCPACFSETFEKDLRKNKVLDDIITHFSNVKEKLKRCFRGQVQFVQSIKDDNLLNKSIATDQNTDNVYPNKQENKIIDGCSLSINSTSPSVSVQKDFSSPSTSGRPKIPLIFTPKSTKRPNITKVEDIKVVMCPVCKVNVSEMNINKHLDDCLKREATKDQPRVVNSKRQPLPKLVFSLMKEPMIRKKLKEFGLSSQGDRKALKSRLHRYIILYNAECDKSNPRPVSEILKQCEEEENLEKKFNKTPSIVNRLQVNRNTEQNIIDDERKKYLEANKDSFENLIRRIKCSDNTNKSSVRRSIFDKSANYNQDIPHKRLAVSEESNDSIDEPEAKDSGPITHESTGILNSDSDTTCPLQMYSSTDPNQFVNIQLSSSCEDDIEQKKSKTKYGKINCRKGYKSSDNLHPEIEDENTNSSHACSIISTKSNKDTKLAIKSENTQLAIEQDMSKYDLDTCNNSVISESKMTSQKRSKMARKDQIRRGKLNFTALAETKLTKSFKEEQEDENVSCNLQESVCDLSSNESIDYKSNYEKENISSSPERSDSRFIRKRSRDSVQCDNEAISSTKKKIRNSPKTCVSETEESNTEESVVGVLHDNENKRVRKKSRLKRLRPTVSIEDGTTALRKSSRTRFKNTML